MIRKYIDCPSTPNDVQRIALYPWTRGKDACAAKLAVHCDLNFTRSSQEEGRARRCDSSGTPVEGLLILRSLVD